jgi:hypothetical protein
MKAALSRCLKALGLALVLILFMAAAGFAQTPQFISGQVTVTVVAAADQSDPNQNVSGLKYITVVLDGVLGQIFIGNGDLGPDTFNFVWDTTLMKNGQHTLTAFATDKAGNQGTATLTVNVRNLGPDTKAPSFGITGSRPTAMQPQRGAPPAIKK